jgi:hypothetical protein
MSHYCPVVGGLETGRFLCCELAKGAWTARLGGFLPTAVAMETLDLSKLGHLENGDPVELGSQMAGLALWFRYVKVWVIGTILLMKCWALGFSLLCAFFFTMLVAELAHFVLPFSGDQWRG